MTLIVMRNVENKPLHRALWLPLKCKMFDGSTQEIPMNFTWDGSSSEILAEPKTWKQRIAWTLLYPVNFALRAIFPRWRHPVASCKHDWRCQHAKNSKERKWADQQFEIDVGKTSWWITKKIGYMGVRTGALLGIGVRY